MKARKKPVEVEAKELTDEKTGYFKGFPMMDGVLRERLIN